MIYNMPGPKKRMLLSCTYSYDIHIPDSISAYSSTCCMPENCISDCDLEQVLSSYNIILYYIHGY